MEYETSEIQHENKNIKMGILLCDFFRFFEIFYFDHEGKLILYEVFMQQKLLDPEI